MLHLHAVILFLASLTTTARHAVSPPDLDLILLRLHLSRFPSSTECNRWLNRTDEHLVYISQHMLLFVHDREDWRRYREQVVAWRDIWEELETCRIGATTRDDACRMERIRAVIGEDNYRAGYVPPPIASYFLFAYPEGVLLMSPSVKK